MNFLEGAVVGLAVGVFAPGLARKLKAVFVEYTQKLKNKAKVEVKL